MIRHVATIVLTVLYTGPVELAIGQESLCGARCVHRVLELVGKDEELTDVIQELHSSPAGGQLSFADLAKFLEQRGVSCRLLELGTFDVPRSPDPMVLHVHGNHFVVIDKVDLWSADVWDGLQGTNTVAWWRLRPICSDAVLICTQNRQDTAYADVTYQYLVMSVGGALLIFGITRLNSIVRRYRIQSAHRHR